MAKNEALEVAVIGLGSFGRLTLQGLCESRLVRVVGVADRNGKLAAQVGSEMKVPAYADNRSLLAETRPKIVYLAVPPTASGELITACAERGIHVWKEQPLARNLDEAVAFVQRMEQAGLKFAVGTHRRFTAGYGRAYELREKLGRIFLGRAHYLFNWGPNLGWRGDKASAGGGALLELGYHAIDLLIWMLGLPEQVYGLTACGNRPGDTGPSGEPLPIYDTDDTAAAILNYKSGAMTTVVTTRSSGPVSEELALHGRGGSLTACSESCLFRDPDGNVLDRTDEEPASVAPFRRQAEAFAKAVINNDASWPCSARENLLTMAVLEAIYLSARTSQPENPASCLHTRGVPLETIIPRKQQAPDAPAEKSEGEFFEDSAELLD